MMIKPVSILAMTIVGLMSAFPSDAVQMTSQIRRLLEQKEEKVKQLEECEGKKKGWMIAGISTIGLTAVGVGVNIAQASKSSKLSDEINQSKQELERQQEKLSGIESQISAKEREKAERERVATVGNAGDGAAGTNAQNKSGTATSGGSSVAGGCMIKDDPFCVLFSDDDDGEVLHDVTWTCHFENTESVAVWDPVVGGYCHNVQIPCDAQCTLSIPDGTKARMTAMDWANEMVSGGISLPSAKSAGLLDNKYKSTNYGPEKLSAKETPKLPSDITVKNNTDETINLAQKSAGLLSNTYGPASVDRNNVPSNPKALSEVTLVEQNKDMARLNSIIGNEGSKFEVVVPVTREAASKDETESEMTRVLDCRQSGGNMGFGGKCNCLHSKGLTRSTDGRTCVCEESGYKYSDTKDKCVPPDRQEIMNFIDELEIKSKDQFL